MRENGEEKEGVRGRKREERVVGERERTGGSERRIERGKWKDRKERKKG